MFDFSKETHVGFLREAAKTLQEELVLAKKELAEVKRQKLLDEQLCQDLSERLLILRKKFFVGGREQCPSTKKMPSSKRKRRLSHSQPAACPPPKELVMDSELIMHTEDKAGCDLPNCGMQAMTGGYEDSIEVNVTEKKYVLRRHRRQKYVCKTCGKIQTAKKVALVTPGARFSLGMAIEVADNKYQRHLPLNRQVEMMAENGLRVEAKTLYFLLESLAKIFEALSKRVCHDILSSPYVHIDETPVKILATKSRGFIWCLTSPFGAYYHFDMSRSGLVAGELLKDFGGIVVSDGFSGYERFAKEHPEVRLALCWSHVRRKFYEAAGKWPEAEQALSLIDQLYEIEHQTSDFSKLAQLRRQQSGLMLDQLRQWLIKMKGRYLDSSSIGKAIFYLKKHWAELSYFINDAYVPLDNNAAERGLRQPVLGRKNYHGFRTVNGADVAMVFFTIIMSCRLFGVSAREYMTATCLAYSKGEALMTPYEYAEKLERNANSQTSFSLYSHVS